MGTTGSGNHPGAGLARGVAVCAARGLGVALCAVLGLGACGGTGVPVGRDGGAAEAATADGPPACLTRDGGCDPVRQTGCEDGRKCSLVGIDLACVSLGTGAAGDACQAIVGGDSCGAGLVCASAGGASTCVQFCDRVCGEPCGGDTRCNTRLGDSGEWGCGPLPPPCDLLAQDCAGAGEACYLLEPATGTTGCMTEGTLPENAACTTQGECAGGHVCLASQAGGLAVCVPLCDTRDAATCAGGVCSALPHLDPVGYCH